MKLIRVLSFILILLLTIPFQRIESSAQTTGLIITPGNVRLEVGNSYKVKFTNKTNSQFNGFVEAIALKPEKEGAVRPLVQSEVEAMSINLEDYIYFDKSEILVDKNQSEEFSVKYLKKLPNYFVGVAIVEKSSDDNVSISSIITSYIVDFEYSEDQLDQNIESVFEIKNKSSFLGFSVGDSYNISLKLKNNFEHKIVATGEVEVYIKGDEKIRVDQITLTPDLIDGISPGETLEIIKEFKDKRDIYERKGEIEAVLNLNVEGTILQKVDNIDSRTPIEYVILIIFFIVALIFVGVVIFVKRQSIILKIKK